MHELAAAVGVDRQDVAALLATLTARRLTVATAESLTGGLLAALLTELPGSSAVVRGGLVAYATDLKHRLAGVDDALLARRGAVDPEVAWQLAVGARLRCGADVGIGLTGVAGPDPQDGKPVGTFYCAVAGPAGYRDERASGPGELERDSLAEAEPDPTGVRRRVRAAAVRSALQMLANIPATIS
jgi:nicotinamide-nucleotide amidase